VTSIFYFVFLFASSMFYPLEPLPAGFRQIAMLNPITWQVDLLRYATVGAGEPSILVWEAVGFLVFTAATFWAALQALYVQE
jgi:ABC-type polysaccharide/polyol phosphate export permease